MIFDSTDNYTLLLTSECCMTPSPGLEEFTWAITNGTAHLIPTTSQPRVFGRLADDPSDHEVVLLASTDQNGSSINQTWTYRAGNWTPLPSAGGPNASSLTVAEFCYDAAIHADVLFYYYSQLNATRGWVYDNETWTFAAGRWTEVLNSTPSGFPHFLSMIYDAADGYLVAFGSSYHYNLTTGFQITDNSTWKFENNSWTRINTTSPSELTPSLVYDPDLGKVLLIGGYTYITGSSTTDPTTWAYRAGNWTALTGAEIPGLPPGPRMTATSNGVLAYVPPPYQASPSNTTAYSSFWFLNNTTWIVPSASDWTPVARGYGQVAYDSGDGYLLSFGGWTDTANYYSGWTFNDTWIYRDGDWSLVQSNKTPPGRYYGSIADDPSDGYVVMFGGAYGGAYGGWRTDTWTYHAGNWTQQHPVRSPAIPIWSCMAYDVADRYVLLFGGYNGTSNFNQTWEFHAGNWTELYPAISPPTMNRCSMAYDPNAGYLLLFGNNQTWTYSGGNWTHIATGWPYARQAPLMAFDPNLGGVVMYGGGSGGIAAFNELWLFANGSWTQLSEGMNPNGAGFGGAADDPEFGTVVLFVGAAFGPYRSQIWRVGENVPLSVGPVNISSTHLDVGQTLRLRSSVLGGTGDYDYQWTVLPPGCVPSNSSAITCAPSMAGNYTANISVTDSKGARGNGTSPAFVVSTDPVLSNLTITPSAIDAGQPVRFSVSLYGGSPPFSMSWGGLPTGCVSGNSTNLSCSPAASGNFTITAIVTDGLGYRATISANLTVAGPLTIFALTSSSSTIDLGETMRFSADVSGGTGNRTFTWSGLPPGCTGANASTVTCTPNSTGTYSVWLNASDSVGEAATAGPASLQVNAVLGSPSVSTSSSSADVGQTVYFHALVLGGTAPYTYDWSYLPSGCSNMNVANLSCTLTSVGNATVHISVVDATSATASGSGSRFESYPDPAVSSIALSRTVVDAGQIWTANVSVQVSNGTFSVSWVGIPTNCSTSGTGGAMVTCTSASPGTTYIAAVATDSRNFSVRSAAAMIEVETDPTIAAPSVSPAVVDLGQKISLSVQATALSPYSLVWTGLPGGCTAPGGSSPSWSCTPNSTGTFEISARLTDGNGFAVTSATTTVVVYPPLTVLQPVANVSTPTVGVPFEIEVTITGGGGGNHVVWSDVPSTCRPLSGSWNETCTVNAPGVYHPQATVSDREGSTLFSPAGNLTITYASVSGPRPVPTNQSSPSGGIGGVFGLPLWTWIALVVGTIAAVLVVICYRRGRGRPAVEGAESLAGPSDVSDGDGLVSSSANDEPPSLEG